MQPFRGAARPRPVQGIFAALTLATTAAAQDSGRVRLRFDTAEAVAVVRILDRLAGRTPVDTALWQSVLSSEAYTRLRAREAGLGRAFSDSQFVAFVRSDTLVRRRNELARTLREWERGDVRGAAARALAYLPPEARIRATVYVVIKPRTNSFVYDVLTNPAIFLYLDPSLSGPRFENTVAHELHHIGYSSVSARADSNVAKLPERARRAAEWLGAFGEGYAMLAAAGGPDVHPHAVSRSDERARWDHDIANFNVDLRRVDRFFIDVIEGRLATPDTIQNVALSFFGEQGPWYTVGWKMAEVIERRYGRAALIESMFDPRGLLVSYNTAAAGYNRTHSDSLALFSAALLRALEREPAH